MIQLVFRMMVMARYRRARVAGGTYFFTVVTERRQRVLVLPEVRAALRAAIENVRVARPFDIKGWVLLPDHIHAIWTLPADDADFATRWRLIKSHVTRQCAFLFNADFQTRNRAAKHCGTLWQHRYWEHLQRDEADLRQHLNYLHWNPVKHGLVQRVADWPWSSFHRYVTQGAYPPDWGLPRT